jgi:hypothetical protein
VVIGASRQELTPYKNSLIRKKQDKPPRTAAREPVFLNKATAGVANRDGPPFV